MDQIQGQALPDDFAPSFRNGKATGADGEEITLPKALGIDPQTSQEVSLRKGPYGVYVQLGRFFKAAELLRQQIFNLLVPLSIFNSKTAMALRFHARLFAEILSLSQLSTDSSSKKISWS